MKQLRLMAFIVTLLFYLSFTVPVMAASCLVSNETNPPTTNYKVGDEVTYSIRVENLFPLDENEDNYIIDVKVSNYYPDETVEELTINEPDSILTLNEGESILYELKYTIEEGDLTDDNTVVNTVYVDGYDSYGDIIELKLTKPLLVTDATGEDGDEEEHGSGGNNNDDDLNLPSDSEETIPTPDSNPRPGGEIVIPPVTAPPPAQPEPKPNKIEVSPKRVPAGDPEITVFPGSEASRVYAVLPDGDKLELKMIKEGVWKKSFLVPFGTPDGPYDIKVYVVDLKGNEREHIYRITIDNTLPLLKVKEMPQDNGEYSLEIKPLFNARSMYYITVDSGEQIEFKKNKGVWVGNVPRGKGYILAIDESGYEVKQDLDLGLKTEETISAAEENIETADEIGSEESEPVIAVNQETVTNESHTDSSRLIYILIAVIGIPLGILFGARYSLS